MKLLSKNSRSISDQLLWTSRESTRRAATRENLVHLKISAFLNEETSTQLFHFVARSSSVQCLQQRATDQISGDQGIILSQRILGHTQKIISEIISDRALVGKWIFEINLGK